MSFFTQVSGLVGFLAVPNLLGYVSGYPTNKASIEYYKNLNKPFWSPPRVLFQPIWIIMFLINGLASFLVWNEGFTSGISVNIPLLLYTAQLLCALTWTPTFFRVKSPFLSLLNIFCTFSLAILTVFTFAVISSTATKLFSVYVLWLLVLVCFNRSVWRMSSKPSKPKKKRSKLS
ncbi:hypothetical protein DSO57_1010351 [Entomophthora muscae]|uniref:Uncharacterized protein n=1 Tax=Entomophthora muscae TaxID=34485 RepID=A0ACC2UG78_9FUNG|nr:hypothetical protein DSO57_1010351 [Entomophthora muscae]